MKTILVDAVNCFLIKGEGFFEEMHQLLEGYPNTKIILTNADKQQMEDFGLDKAPYDVFTLERNPSKTDPEFYRIFLDSMELESEEVIYFEHNKEAVESAKSVGITTYWYDPEEKDLWKLKEFLDKNI